MDCLWLSIWGLHPLEATFEGQLCHSAARRQSKSEGSSKCSPQMPPPCPYFWRMHIYYPSWTHISQDPKRENGDQEMLQRLDHPTEQQLTRLTRSLRRTHLRVLRRMQTLNWDTASISQIPKQHDHCSVPETGEPDLPPTVTVSGTKTSWVSDNITHTVKLPCTNVTELWTYPCYVNDNMGSWSLNHPPSATSFLFGSCCSKLYCSLPPLLLYWFLRLLFTVFFCFFFFSFTDLFKNKTKQNTLAIKYNALLHLRRRPWFHQMYVIIKASDKSCIVKASSLLCILSDSTRGTVWPNDTETLFFLSIRWQRQVFSLMSFTHAL